MQEAWSEQAAAERSPLTSCTGRKFSAPRANTFGGPFVGTDKWLGGTLGNDGVIYGIPGSGKSVLRIVPETGEATTIGSCRGLEFKSSIPGGKFRWLRGILARDNCIYGLPSNADYVLRIIPETQEVVSVGLSLQDGSNPDSTSAASSDLTKSDCSMKGNWKWHGGVLSPIDGAIYCIPCNAEQVLKIKPGQTYKSQPEVTLIGPKLEGAQKWYGGLLGPDGAIYGIPYNSDTVLRIVPGDEPTISTFGSLPKGGWKWHGGVVAPGSVSHRPLGAHAHDNLKCSHIVGVPSHADSVLNITVWYCDGNGNQGDQANANLLPPPPEINIIIPRDGPLPNGSVARKGYKYGGGVVGCDGNAYALPSDADRVLKIDPKSQSAWLIGPEYECLNKWQNGFLGRDGCVYAIPTNFHSVLRIHCETEEVSVFGDEEWPGKEKWEGGVEGNDGVMYCMPQQSLTVLKIIPGEALS